MRLLSHKQGILGLKKGIKHVLENGCSLLASCPAQFTFLFKFSTLQPYGRELHYSKMSESVTAGINPKWPFHSL